MRIAPCLAVVVACSSAPAKPEEPVVVARPVVFDAAPIVVADRAIPDATVEEPCVDDQELAALYGDRIVVCPSEDDQGDRPPCHAFAADGTVNELPGFDVWPSAMPVEDDDEHTWVDVCTALDSCARVEPPGDAIYDASVNQTGTEVAIVVDDAVEIWSVSTRKRLASKAMPDVQDLAYVGGALLIVDTDAAARLWHRSGKKLVADATIDGRLSAWTTVDPKTAAFVVGDEIVVIETTKGERVGQASWADLFGDTAYDRLHSLQIRGAGGKVAVVAQAFDDHDDTVTRAGVFALDATAPTRFAIPFCEGHVYIDRWDAECLKNPLGCRK